MKLANVLHNLANSLESQGEEANPELGEQLVSNCSKIQDDRWVVMITINPHLRSEYADLLATATLEPVE